MHADTAIRFFLEDLPCKRVTKEEFQDNFHNFKRDQLSLIDLRSGKSAYSLPE